MSISMVRVFIVCLLPKSLTNSDKSFEGGKGSSIDSLMSPVRAIRGIAKSMNSSISWRALSESLDQS